MHNIFKKILPLTMIIGITLFLYRNLFGSGIPATHDGPMHLVRMINYYLALKQGQLPPRIGPHLANHFGYPVFNYNYPLGSAVATPFIVANFDYDAVYQLVVALFLIIGALGWNYLIRSHGFSRLQVLLGVVLFLTSPYLVQLIFARGNIGEIAAFCLIPLVLWRIKIFAEQKTYSQGFLLGIIGGIYMLSHNIFVWQSSIFLVAYVLYSARKNAFISAKWLVPLAIGLGSSAFFWMPALGEKAYVILDDSPISLEYKNHFLYLPQLLSGKFGYGYSRLGPVDGLSFNFTIVGLLGLFVAAYQLLRTRRTPLLLLTIGTVISAFFSLSASSFIWEMIPLGPFIQFPWRMLWISQVFLIGLWVYVSKISKLRPLVIAALIMVSVAISLPHAKPQYRDIRSNETWFLSGETTSTLNENLPKQFNLMEAYSLADTVLKDTYIWTSDTAATPTMRYWNGTSREYEIVMSAAGSVVEKTAFFPGWEVSANGKKVEVNNKDPWGVGLVHYQLEPGSYVIQSGFTQNTPWRMTGNTISLLSVLTAVWFYIRLAVQRSKKS
jgi:uncharacterized membrane protein